MYVITQYVYRPAQILGFTTAQPSVIDKPRKLNNDVRLSDSRVTDCNYRLVQTFPQVLGHNGGYELGVGQGIHHGLHVVAPVVAPVVDHVSSARRLDGIRAARNSNSGNVHKRYSRAEI